MKALPENIDWKPEDIVKEIREREGLIRQMVGTLYPSILWSEILKLRQAYISATRRFDY